jgi:threonine aldolase
MTSTNVKSFASDNNSGVHPAIMEAIQQANSGHVRGYGADAYTAEAIQKFREIFGDDTEVFFVFNGTGANVVGLSSITLPFQAIICAQGSHINVDECGAPEHFTGAKLIDIPTPNGKLTPELIKPHLHGFGVEHHVQPRVISITQATETGTVYTVEEIRAIAELAHSHGMLLHMDGARIANAAVALDLPFKAFTRAAGVDVLSFGGTKNGMMMGEAVVIFDPALAKNTIFYRKQGMQLASKMRFIAAQFIALLTNDLWHKNASHANRMAALLAAELEKTPHVKITQQVQINSIFAIIPPEAIAPLQEKYFFYIWDEAINEVRWMTAFDTTVEDVYSFVTTLKEILERNKR